MNATFQTGDTDLATYLYSQSYRLLHVWDIGNRTVFVFPKEAEASAEAFYQGACCACEEPPPRMSANPINRKEHN